MQHIRTDCPRCGKSDKRYDQQLFKDRVLVLVSRCGRCKIYFAHETGEEITPGENGYTVI